MKTLKISLSDIWYVASPSGPLPSLLKLYPWGERSGLVVECLTRDRGALGLSLSSVTALWSLSKTHLSYLSTGSTQEDLSLFNWKIVDGT